MSFDITTRAVLEKYTNYPPRTEDAWYGLWNTILTTLFPSNQGYVVTPQRRAAEGSQIGWPGFLIEVAKLSAPPVTLRTVLIIQIKNSQNWELGDGALMRQIRIQTDLAFAGTATKKVYWIGIIGPHWKYGEMEYEGQDLRPMIEWHDVTHDEASYRDLVRLVDLVALL
jgi:hypothetical protein